MRGYAYPAHTSLPMTKLSSASRTRIPLWQRLFVFLVGFSIQFNALIGGEGGGASATGGYGYRLTDFVAVCAFGLLVLLSIAPHRIIPIGIFGLMVAASFLYPMISQDQRTSILAMHYALYSFAALYVAVILSKPSAIEWFCRGLIVGLLATVPIFVLQDLNYTQTLITWGLTPGYFQETGVLTSDVLRYTGLWGHPNEAGHVAALSAAAGAYLAIVRHRYAPLVIIAASLLAIFYYAISRGGLIAGGAALVVPFLLSRGRLNIGRLVALIGTVAIAIIAVSNIDFVATRFQDPNETSNIQDRLDFDTLRLADNICSSVRYVDGRVDLAGPFRNRWRWLRTQWVSLVWRYIRVAPTFAARCGDRCQSTCSQ